MNNIIYIIYIMSALGTEAIAGIVIGSAVLLGLGYGLSGSSGSPKQNAQADANDGDGADAVSETIENEQSSLSDLNRISGVPELDNMFRPENPDVVGRNRMYTPSGKLKTTGNQNVTIDESKNKVLEIPSIGNSNPVIRKSTTKISSLERSKEYENNGANKSSEITGGKRKSKKTKKSKKSKKSKKTKKTKKID